MAAFDTTEFLASVRRKAIAPDSATNTDGWDDTDLLAVGNEQLLLQVAQLIDQREGYKTAVKDIPLVADREFYPVPARAVLGKVRSIQLVDSAGKVVATLDEVRQADLLEADVTAGQPEKYHFRDTFIIVHPKPSSATLSLRVTYYRRANRMVAATTGASGNIGVVLSKTSTTVTLTTTKPSGFTTSSPLDFIRGTPHFDAMADDKTPTAASGSSLTFAAGVIPTDLAAGDYVCLAGEAPVPQLPAELHQVLARRTANAMLNGTDGAALEQGVGELMASQQVLDSATTPRNEGEQDQSSNWEFLDP